MPAEIAPAPPAPSPTPTPLPSPAPSATPSPAASAPPMWETAIDAIEEGTPVAPAKPAKEEPPSAGATPPKPEPASTAPKPEEGEAMPKFQTSKDMRDWANRRHQAALTVEREKKALEAKLKELEGRVPKTEEGAAILAQKVAEAEKRIKDYEAVIEQNSFESSTKFRTEFQQPYSDSRAKAVRAVKELKVQVKTDQVDADGNPVMGSRPATEKDFEYIYGLPTAEAWDAAEELFGKRAPIVMQHRENVSLLAEKAIMALEDHKKNLDKYRQENIAQQQFQQTANQRLWQVANEKISADPKRQDYWGEDKDDAEANKHLAAGFQVADLFFSADRDKMSVEDRIMFDAAVRHRIAGFGRLAYKYRKVKAELDARNEEVAKLRGSSPGKPTPTSPEAGEIKHKDFESAIDALPE